MLRAIFREGEKKTKPKMRAHEAVYKRTLTLNFPKIYGVSSGGAGGTYSTKKGVAEAKTRLWKLYAALEQYTHQHCYS